jgi:hypothetical protein
LICRQKRVAIVHTWGAETVPELMEAGAKQELAPQAEIVEGLNRTLLLEPMLDPGGIATFLLDAIGNGNIGRQPRS